MPIWNNGASDRLHPMLMELNVKMYKDMNSRWTCRFVYHRREDCWPWQRFAVSECSLSLKCSQLGNRWLFISAVSLLVACVAHFIGPTLGQSNVKTDSIYFYFLSQWQSFLDYGLPKFRAISSILFEMTLLLSISWSLGTFKIASLGYRCLLSVSPTCLCYLAGNWHTKKPKPLLL